MNDYNCFTCFKCGLHFSRPYETRKIDTITRTEILLSQRCPKCGSEDIDRDFDEDYDEYLREMWEGDRDAV